MESQPLIHDEETVINGESNVTASGPSEHGVIHEDSNITNSGNSEHGVIT